MNEYSPFNQIMKSCMW